MPTYGYECRDCRKAFEVIQKMSDAPLRICGACGGALKKIMFPVGIVFKGSGFHVNDYAKKGDNSSSKGTSDSTAPAAEAKTDAAKPEAVAKTDGATTPAADAKPSATSPSSAPATATT